ncbi:MAG: hypothetical protein AB7G93_09820 [Bdellovibrionales bacterium]
MSNASKWVTILIFVGPWAVAKDVPQKPRSQAVKAEMEVEHVITQQNLATHLGLTEDEAVFGRPREHGLRNYQETKIELQPLSVEEEIQNKYQADDGGA